MEYTMLKNLKCLTVEHILQKKIVAALSSLNNICDVPNTLSLSLPTSKYLPIPQSAT